MSKKTTWRSGGGWWPDNAWKAKTNDLNADDDQVSRDVPVENTAAFREVVAYLRGEADHDGRRKGRNRRALRRAAGQLDRLLVEAQTRLTLRPEDTQRICRQVLQLPYGELRASATSGKSYQEEFGSLLEQSVARIEQRRLP